MEGYTLSVTYLNSKKSTKGHRHKWDEAYFVCHGEGIIELDDQYIPIKRGQFIRIESNTFHKVSNTGPSILTLVCAWRGKCLTTVVISGGFDPIHPGHIAYIEEAMKLGDRLIIILTRDDQLIEKDKLMGNIKGRLPIPYKVRKANLEWGLKGRGKVVENIDKDITSCKSLRKYHPDIFAKGGDSWDIDNLPEKEVCDELGIRVVFGVGGHNKPYSSSQLGRGNRKEQ